MAYYMDPTDDDEQNLNVAGGVTNTAPDAPVTQGQGGGNGSKATSTPQPSNPQSSNIGETGSSNVAQSGNTDTSTQTVNPNPTSPNNFVGIQQYLDANQPQATQLGQQVGNQVTQAGQTAQTALTNAQSNFTNDINNDVVQLNPNIVSEANTNASLLVNTPSDLAEFQKEQNANYTGPNSFNSSSYYQPVLDAINNAQNVSNQSQTASGQQALVTQLEQSTGAPVTQGDSVLDQGLLSSQGAQNAIQAANNGPNNANNLNSWLSSTNAADTVTAGVAQQDDQQTAAAIAAILNPTTGAQAQLVNQINSQVANQQAAATANNQNIIASLKQDEVPLYQINGTTSNPNQVSQDQIASALGLSTSALQQLLTSAGADSASALNGPNQALPDLTQYITQNNPSTSINAANVANAQQYAQYAALNQLAGTNNQVLSNPSLASSAPTSSLSFDDANALAYLQKIAPAANANGAVAPGTITTFGNSAATGLTSPTAGIPGGATGITLLTPESQMTLPEWEAAGGTQASYYTPSISSALAAPMSAAGLQGVTTQAQEQQVAAAELANLIAEGLSPAQAQQLQDQQNADALQEGFYNNPIHLFGG